MSRSLSSPVQGRPLQRWCAGAWCLVATTALYAGSVYCQTTGASMQHPAPHPLLLRPHEELPSQAPEPHWYELACETDRELQLGSADFVSLASEAPADIEAATPPQSCCTQDAAKALMKHQGQPCAQILAPAAWQGADSRQESEDNS